jgi:hypothetical protein
LRIHASSFLQAAEQKYAEIMPIKGIKPWTEGDDRGLIGLRAAGRSAASIFAALTRTVNTVLNSILQARAGFGHLPGFGQKFDTAWLLP